MNYKSVIGLEVHVELKTKSKMFCGCSADYFGHEPNTHVCPVCLGLPGALPVPNKTAIEWCVMIGLALNCQIPLVSKFDRKNYFYPDLPKGYQISQYDQPFAINGSLKFKVQSSKFKVVKIRRVHMEEDTAKLVHQQNLTLIDFNRSGVPLVEIVTEPDFESASEVVEYLKKLQQIVRYLDVSNADMEKGDMRLEPNISVREIRNPKSEIRNKKLPKYKVEVKNINSFRFVEKAINYEIDRQMRLLELSQTPVQETRGWDENKQKTFSQRTKEEAHDYRYFPEPDIPPIRWTESKIEDLRFMIEELPDEKLERFQKEYGLLAYNAEILTREKAVADYFEEAARAAGAVQNSELRIQSKAIANWIINKKINIDTTLPAKLIQIILSATQTVAINEKELEKIINDVLKSNKKAVEDYKKGKKSAIMFLVGQVLRKLPKKVDPKKIKDLIKRLIEV